MLRNEKMLSPKEIIEDCENRIWACRDEKTLQGEETA